MSGERALREAVGRSARALHARGWVANHDGNVTARLAGGRGGYLCTPTATSKADVTERNLLVLDERGERVSGDGKPFSELGLHLAVYARRADVHAVVHAHPPFATALAVSGSRLLERLFLAEAVVSLGASVPTVPFALPGAPARAALEPYLDGLDAVLLANHGVLTWGADVEQATLRMELVEHLARMAVEAERVGGVRALPESAMPALLAARKQAGLGPEARGPTAKGAPAHGTSIGAAPKRVVACAPAPAGSDVETIAPSRPATGELATLIREELTRALRDGR